MFIAAYLIGCYSYLLFVLGLLGWLYRPTILFLTMIFFVGSIVLFRKKITKVQLGKQPKIFYLLLTLFFSLTLVNFIGVLGPELGFDALWYHLTLPKIYLNSHAVFFIPGGLLYYSAMPKLAEMLYVGGLSLGNESVVKFIHFSFGLLTCFALYKLARKFFNSLISFIGVIIFYSNLVVAWESASAYIDLVRTFFEVMAVWGFVNWWLTQKKKWLVASAVMLGLEITTKVLALGSLVIFSFLIVYHFFQVDSHKEKRIKLRGLFIRLFVYWITALVIPSPWFLFAYIYTGNPFYPLFSPYLMDLNGKVVNQQIFSPLHFLVTSWKTFTQATDPVSPVYLIFLPIIIWVLIKKKVTYFYLVIYLGLGFGVWYLTSGIEGTRLLLPYLPIFSLLVAGCMAELFKQKRYGTGLGKIALVLVIITTVVTIGYRFVANEKYLPIILGKQTRGAFLSERLNFAFGDFYDTDGYFKTHLKSTDRVLLFGFHNLYYVDFPFIDSSWIQKGDRYKYVATQKTNLSPQYKDWKLVYENDKTMVKLYKQE